MKYPSIVLAGLLALLSCGRRPQPTGSASFTVTNHLSPKGWVDVEETITLDLKRGGALTRLLPMPEGTDNLLLRQRIDRVVFRADGPNGPVLPFRLRTGDYWANIDLLNLKPGKQVLYLSYRILHPHRREGRDGVFVWQCPASFWNLTVTALDITWRVPDTMDPKRLKVKNAYYYSETVKGTVTTGKNSIRFVATKQHIKPGKHVEFTLTFPFEGIARNGGTSSVRELTVQGRITLITFAVLLLLALVALFLPARRAISLTAAANWLYPIALAAILWGPTVYWWNERNFRAPGDSNALLSFLTNPVYILFYLYFAYLQRKGFAAWKRNAYYVQLAVMPILTIPFMIPGTEFLLFGLLGLPALIYWHRREIAWQFGAGVDVIVEKVNAQGALSLKELAASVQLSDAQLENILRQNPNLPVIPDYAEGSIVSMETAAMREQLKVCPSCGGGSTVTVGQALLECAYCGTPFSASRKPMAPVGETGTDSRSRRRRNRRDVKTPNGSFDLMEMVIRTLRDPFNPGVARDKPVPFVVEGIAAFLTTAAMGAFFYAVLLGVVFLGLETFEGSGLVSGVFMGGVTLAVLGGLGIALIAFAEELRKGKLYTLLQILLVLTAPLLVSLVALRKIWTPLCKLHFGEKDPRSLEALLKEKGELSLAELTKELDTSYGEATDIAAYLAGHQIIAAVYDRVHARLVHRDLYATMSHEGSCASCGGILGVHHGKVACQYCGTTVETAPPLEAPPA